jgi:inner membrane protein
MMLPNHVVGSFAISGIIGGLCGENIFQTKVNLICVILFGILPDIDNPKSPVSYLCRPFSVWLSRHYGHRTVTHSLPALVAVVAVAFVLGYAFPSLRISPLIVGLAYFSHLVLDMATLMGVPLIYPSKESWYLFSNPRYRIRTGAYGTEAMCFGGFCLLTSFSFPLMENGFWTTYNTSFGTPKTLHSEFVKSPDLMTAVCVWQVGSDVRTDSGALVSCVSETSFTLWRNDSFFHFDAAKQIIKSVIPTHTKRLFYFETKPFISLDADSLTNLLRGRIVLELDANSSEPFRYYENGMPTRSLNCKINFPHKLYFQSLDSQLIAPPVFVETDFASSAIRNDLATLERSYSRELEVYNRSVTEWKETERAMIAETRPVDKEKLQRLVQDLSISAKVRSPQRDEVRKLALESSLKLSVERFRNDEARRAFERERAFVALVRAKPKTTFTGVVKWVRIE